MGFDNRWVHQNRGVSTEHLSGSVCEIFEGARKEESLNAQDKIYFCLATMCFKWMINIACDTISNNIDNFNI